METGRYVTLTKRQAVAFWKSRDIDQTDFAELLDAVLEPGEKIIGIGSFGSPKPEDQRVLFIEKTQS
jgi:hypothetical protein